MKSVDNKIYIDLLTNRVFIKVRDIGYQVYAYVYAYIKEDGTLDCVSGCVGPDFGWKRNIFTLNQLHKKIFLRDYG